MTKFGGFWCRKCGGRVFEDEPYVDDEGTLMAVLTCLLCAQEHQCKYRDYRKLLASIEKTINEKRNKANKWKVLYS